MTGRVKVLIVDSDPEAREQAAVLLGGFGFTVLQAETGADALHLARGMDELTLLVAATRLSDTSGERLAAASLRFHPDLKVLLSEDFGGERTAGDYPVIRKPYRFGPFIRAIRGQLLPA